MRIPTAAAALAIVAVAVLLSSGCSAPDATPVTTAKPTSTPIFASDEEALAAAEAAYEAYQTMEDQIFADGGKDPDRIRPYAVRDALEDALSGYANFRREDLRVTGNVKFDHSALTDFSPTAPNGVDAASMVTCTDLSAVDVLDSSNVSTVPADRQPRQTFDMKFDLVDGMLKLSSREKSDGVDVCV